MPEDHHPGSIANDPFPRLYLLPASGLDYEKEMSGD
jgi:hypothetical protein